ncbi:ATP-binding protein [Aeromicrobium endophyticum]|uniref:ATP-binding protein n=1 Tax=Aeromicrobium endophyticum TaxID=2292704 RepID=UPI001F36A2EA|nr:ATP-binding protein [Aeromicrobium endophyticum]
MQTEDVQGDEDRRRQRGVLRVYLGASPGVGKTYAMLDEGRRRAERGTDVVVGFVETHGRVHTAAQVEGLEVVPRLVVDHRGTRQEELDVQAVLARMPEVVLVDELAHTNVPGVGHEKRWQDVEDLLAAGICVITTVNIQHLESLNDVVESITGIRQRETVPDKIVRGADAIELVDMSPQSLRRRMAHGNVYAPDKVDAALSRFFREGNLTALRELALLWLADRVEEGLDRYRDQHEIDSTWATRERIVVAVTGGPESEVLMRRAARIASRTGGGEWLGLYVTRGDGLVQMDPARLHRLHVMTEDMGGTFHSVVGDDTATAILDFAKAENATQVLIGASRRGRLSTLANPGVGEIVIAESGDIDVHIVTHDQARRTKTNVRATPELSRRRRLYGYLLGVLGPFVLSGLLLVTPDFHGLPTEAMFFMALVVGTAIAGGRWPAVACSLISGFALNFFFTPPLRTVTIASGDNAFAVVLFVVVGVAVSSVVGLAARRTAQAEKASAEADALTVLSHSLLHAGDFQTLLSNACELFGMAGAAVVTGDGEVLHAYGRPIESTDAADVVMPIDADSSLALVGRALPAADQRLLKAYAAHASVLGERRRAAQERSERRVLAETDRTRTALLAAVSHDLRSPLSAVKAAVSSLRNTEIRWSPEDEQALLETVEEGADRLDALVANLLDMSRIQMGAVTAHVDEVEVEAVVHVALSPLTGADRVDVEVDDAAALVVADAGLLERVVANLVGNALAYAPAPTRVRVDATASAGRVVVRVVDTGPGVPAEQQERLFEAFQRLGDVPQGEGIGLGLAVARGLTEAMGGTLTAEDTPGGGLTFVLDLPGTGAPR